MAQDFHADVTGLAAWDIALTKKFVAVDRSTNVAMRQSLRIVERSYKKILRTYTHPEGTPTTSPPGQPPALVTGTLMRSVVARGPYPGKRPHTTAGTVGPTAVYARIQDMGGRTGRKYRSRLPARPYANPATDRVRPDVRRVFEVRWSQALMS
jgi:phage gpG-like protein